MDGPSAQGFLSLTALQAEGCGIALGHTFGVRVLKMDRPDGRKVLKFDGLSGRGLRIARWAMLMKSALRDWLSVSYVTQYPVPPIFSFPLEVAKELDL